MTNHPRVDYEGLDVGEEQLITWQGQPFTGVAFENFTDGRLRNETELVDGLKQGLSRDWHPNGQLAGDEQFWKGVLHGKRTGWNSDGKLVQEEIYELGILVRGSYFADDGAVTRTYCIDPNDRMLQAYRKAYGKFAPPQT